MWNICCCFFAIKIFLQYSSQRDFLFKLLIQNRCRGVFKCRLYIVRNGFDYIIDKVTHFNKSGDVINVPLNSNVARTYQCSKMTRWLCWIPIFRWLLCVLVGSEADFPLVIVCKRLSNGHWIQQILQLIEKWYWLGKIVWYLFSAHAQQIHTKNRKNEQQQQHQ